MFDIITVPAVFVVTGATFVTVMYLGLGIVYILDFFVRLATNDRYAVINKTEKAK